MLSITFDESKICCYFHCSVAVTTRALQTFFFCFSFISIFSLCCIFNIIRKKKQKIFSNSEKNNCFALNDMRFDIFFSSYNRWWKKKWEKYFFEVLLSFAHQQQQTRSLDHKLPKRDRRRSDLVSTIMVTHSETLFSN